MLCLARYTGALSYTPRIYKYYTVNTGLQPSPDLKGLTKTENANTLHFKPLEAYVPVRDSFAIVHVSGHQYKVTEGDEIMVDVLHLPILSRVLLDKVLLIGTKFVFVRVPTNFTEHKQLLEDRYSTRPGFLLKYKRRQKQKKIHVYKETNHKHKKRRGHRQPYTLLKILDVMVERE
eukprot:TRINITY_DN5876_c0_g1_i18.p1 TRINITY_DN5876_c0_g1~~TRINITY_DN5876_c0_g1_i18.p1  ORF type:complete len:176 (+),score=17.38 TRINITY_DN5876_c0_g1_i18:388-915(+)